MSRSAALRRAAATQRLVGLLAIAAVLIVAPTANLRPALPLPGSLACGVVLGVVLFALLTRRLRPPPLARTPVLRRLALATPIVALGATAEELVWRYGLLGSLLPLIGTSGAVLASSAGFALAHGYQGRRAVGSHLVTGSTFGALYVCSGSVCAAAAAHVAYNLLVVGACATLRGPAAAAKAVA
jgi:membrane protease YdiL (CAAX protease family)